MADGTIKLSLTQRKDVRALLIARHRSLRKCIMALAEVRLEDRNATVSTQLIDVVGTQVRRILRLNDKNPRNGVLTVDWRAAFTGVLDAEGQATLVHILEGGGKTAYRQDPAPPAVEINQLDEKTYFSYRSKSVPLMHSPELIAHLEARYDCRALKLADTSFPVTVIWENNVERDKKSPIRKPDSILGTLDCTEPVPLERSFRLQPSEYAAARAFIKSKLEQGPIKREGWNYRMTRIEVSREGPKIDGAIGLYYDNILTQYALEWELKKALLSGGDGALKRIAKKGSLPMREAIETKCNPLLDGTGRCTAITVSTLLVFHVEGKRRYCLLRRRSQQVAVSPGMLHVVPAGMFEAKNLDMPWSIEMNVWRELLEEIYDEQEQQTGTAEFEDYILRKQPIPWLLSKLSNGTVEFSITGICCDLLTLRPELCTLLLIKDPEFLKVRGPMKFNWEYEADGPAGRIAVEWGGIDDAIQTEIRKMVGERTKRDEPKGGIVCSGAACLALGREWVQRRYGT